mmetsp:Transcript_18520/g.34728  ORF Transcript_18520/g.34728 Transcript_18520/m.34728 type:complete len:201 (-) Transcript_18520:242-844(-)
MMGKLGPTMYAGQQIALQRTSSASAMFPSFTRASATICRLFGVRGSSSTHAPARLASLASTHAWMIALTCATLEEVAVSATSPLDSLQEFRSCITFASAITRSPRRASLMISATLASSSVACFERGFVMRPAAGCLGAALVALPPFVGPAATANPKVAAAHRPISQQHDDVSSSEKKRPSSARRRRPITATETIKTAKGH